MIHPPVLFTLMAPSTNGSPGGGLMVLLFQVVAIGAVFYFLIIRPQGQARKKHQQMLAALKKGDEITTAGGIIGKVKDIKEDRISIEVTAHPAATKNARPYGAGRAPLQRKRAMQQLSGTDNVMLFAERRNNYNHVGALMVYDVSTAPGGRVRFRDVLKHFEDRLHLHPLFRRRLVTIPFGLDRPYWVADPEVDVEYHIRHIALPKPGDWRQLMIQVARLHSRPLDRAHPLWEAYVIEGMDHIPKLPPGAFAVFLKIHHAIVDGMAAVHLMRELHTSTPENEAPGKLR